LKQGLNCKKINGKNLDSDFECVRDGYFPDFSDCAKYYLCSAGTVSVHNCGDGLKWDPELQLCSWSEDIDCRNGRRQWEKFTDAQGGQFLFFFLYNLQFYFNTIILSHTIFD
jgi:hypothetical protein